MVQTSCESNTLTGAQTNNVTCGEGVLNTVYTYLNIGIGKSLVLIGIVKLYHKISAAAIYDVLHFAPMKVHRSYLVFLNNHKLFSIGLRIFIGVLLVSVTESNKEKTCL